MELKWIALPLFLVWFTGMVLYFFRKEAPKIWKISALLIFLFYLLWFFPDLEESYRAYLAQTRLAVSGMVSFLWNSLSFFLLILWPIFLLVAYFTLSHTFSERLIRTMVLLTLFFWLFWMANAMVEKKVKDKILSYVPKKLEMPSLPQMPWSKDAKKKGKAGK